MSTPALIRRFTIRARMNGAIAVVLTPVLQGIAFAIAAPMAWWAEKWIRAEAP